jgi:hypothetical protein
MLKSCASPFLAAGLALLLAACVFQQGQLDGMYPSQCAAGNAPSAEGDTQPMANYCNGMVPERPGSGDGVSP